MKGGFDVSFKIKIDYEVYTQKECINNIRGFCIFHQILLSWNTILIYVYLLAPMPHITRVGRRISKQLLSSNYDYARAIKESIP